MHNNLFKRIFSYTHWILASYQAISKLNAGISALRLISIKRDRNNEIFFKIQIVGKNIFPVISLRQILEPRIFNNFSQENQKQIHYYLSHKNNFYKCISAKTYDRNTKKFIYTIEFFDFESQKKKSMMIENIAGLLGDIHSFDEEDAFYIYSTAAQIE